MIYETEVLEDILDYEKLDIDYQLVDKYMSIKGFRLLVLPDFKDRTTKSGIYIPNHEGNHEMNEAGVETGIVVSIGPMSWKGIKGYDYDTHGPWCKLGDHIIYSKYSGKFQYDPVLKRGDGSPVKYAVINDEDVQLVLNDELIKEIRAQEGSKVA